MANRPAYSINSGKVIRKDYDFQWYAGFAPSQKQKSINALHEAITKADSNAKPLEISTKSTVELGQKLSAFNLRYNGHTLENIFQSSKVFANDGPYRDILEVPPKDAKKDERLRNSGELVRFNYNNYDFPLEPKTLFYDYIYINAVKESLTSDEIQQIKDYTCFTDIEFNPQKSINTQAKTVAIIKLMLDMYGEMPELGIDDFIVFHKQFVMA